MSYRILISFLLFFSSVGAAAQQTSSAFRFGVEWGIGSQVASEYHYNYVDDTGFRVDERGGEFHAAAIGNVMGFAGVNVSDQIGLYLYGGFAGMSDKKRMVPVYLRTSIYPSGIKSNGMFYFFDLGTDASRLISNSSVLADLGLGHRTALCRDLNLDFLLTLRTLQQTPQITDPDKGTAIPPEDIRFSHAGHYAITLSIALEF